jgi:hypothetical protein
MAALSPALHARLNSLTDSCRAMSLRRNRTASSCTLESAALDRALSRRSAASQPQRSNPHSSTSAARPAPARPQLDAPAPAVSLYGLCQGGGVSTGDRSAHLSSCVSFFVRPESPFLRPDPRLAHAGARRSCPRLAVAPTLRHAPPLPGHTLTASSTTARLVRSG